MQFRLDSCSLVSPIGHARQSFCVLSYFIPRGHLTENSPGNKDRIKVEGSLSQCNETERETYVNDMR